MYSVELRILIFLAVSFNVFAEFEDGNDRTDDDGSSDRLYKGNLTSYKEHPYFAQLRGLHPEWRFMCGGAFVARDMILTAAHCLRNETSIYPNDWLKNLTIRYGTNDHEFWLSAGEKFGEGFDLQAVNYFIHPKYLDPATKNTSTRLWRESADYALVQFEIPRVFNYKLLKIPEPGESKPFLTNDRPSTVVAAGSTGINVTEPDPDREYLLKQSQFVMFRRGCPWLSETRWNKKYKSCAFGALYTHRTCQGDSGSPVFADTSRGRVIIAIVSAGDYGCHITTEQEQADFKFPAIDIYSVVGSAAFWILKIFARYSECFCEEELLHKWYLNVHGDR